MEKPTTKGGRPVHVLAIPFPTQGHVYPLLWFSKQLAFRGVTVTFLTYEATIRQITSQKNADDDHVFGKTLRFEILPKIEHVPDEKTSVVEVAEHLYKEFGFHLVKYVQDKKEGRDLPTCIVSDMFLLWTQDVADQLQISRYMMIPSGATLALLTAKFQRLRETGEFQISGKDRQIIKNDRGYSVPGLPRLLHHELPTTIIHSPAAFLKRCQTLWRSSGLLVNTFTGLEDEIIDSYFESKPPEGFGDKKVPKLYQVGPMRSITPDFVESVASDLAQELTSNGCLAWLSSQPRSSVLYVAFGTVAVLSPDNIRELASALEASQQRFLWVMRGSSSDALPEGFEARVCERGFVARDWVPQVEILAHPSTAAFLTHCGWNSSLEGILTGVPMLGWPAVAEQHLNCRDLVNRLKIVEQIQTGPENILRQPEALRAIRSLMVEDEGKLIKERVKRFQKLLAEATAEGGSQSRAIQLFIDDLRQKP